MFKIAPNLSLPAEAVTQTFAILAKRGVGKTYTASVMAEEMLKAGQPIVVIDPVGVWWGLRSGFPITIFGGDRGDLPLEQNAGEIVAAAIVENRFPAILDLSHFRKAQSMRFMVDFAEKLYRYNREALHLFVDEADAVAPQNKNYGGDENRMLGAMEDIVRRGRSRGIGCTMITQRPAVLNKNVLTQCETLVAMRLVHPRDIDAIEEWINVHAEPSEAAEVVASLPTLGVGEAWFWSPGWLGELRRVKIRQRETFDSSSTPKPGQRAKSPKSLAKIDLQALGKQIAATAEQAKANDPAELKRQIKALEKQLANVKPVADEKVIERAVAAAVKDRDRYWEGEVSRISGAAQSMANLLVEIHQKSEPKDSGTLKIFAPPPSVATAREVVVRPRREPRTASVSATIAGEAAALGKAERAILRAFYWTKDENATPAKIGFYANYSFKSGSFRNAVGALRSAGFLNGQQITDRGIALAEQYAEAKPTGEELREWLRPKLGRAENEILDVLIEAHGERMQQADIAAATVSRYSATSGSFRNALGKLRTIEAAEGRDMDGGTKAAEIFFE